MASGSRQNAFGTFRTERKPLDPITRAVIEPGAIRTEWGGIAHETLTKVSGDTAYADQAAQLMRFHRSAIERLGVGPEALEVEQH